MFRMRTLVVPGAALAFATSCSSSPAALPLPEHALDAMFGATRGRPAIVEAAAEGDFEELTVAATPGFEVQRAPSASCCPTATR